MTRQTPKAEFADTLKQIWNTIKGLEGKSAQQVKDDLLDAMIAQGILGEDRGMGGTNPLDYWGKGYVPADRRVIDFLAEIGVRQGHLPATWLERFLGAAGYLQTHRRELIRALYSDPVSALARRSVNLPARQGDFLGRRLELDQVREALQSNWTICLIEGLGGMGKTTLALEVAYACHGQPRGAAQEGGWPRYSTIIWTSADGTTPLTLNSWLDSLAYWLGYAEVAEKPLGEKRKQVLGLLAEQPVLLILDNFETVTDPAIADFMVWVPATVKIVLTSREAAKLSAEIFRRYPPARIHLGGLLAMEALLLVRQEAKRLADLGTGPARARLAEVQTVTDGSLHPLVEITEGNPKALVLALALIADSATPLQTVVQDLHVAAYSVTELLDYLCQWSWDRCSADARALWQVLPFFAAPADRATLATAAGLSGRAFHEAFEQLHGRALVDLQDGADGATRVRAHALVRAFAVAHDSEAATFLLPARGRWVDWYSAYLAQYSQEDWANLTPLDNEQANIGAAITWALSHQHPTAPLLVRQFWPFLYARGYWQQCETWTRQALHQLAETPDPALQLWLSAHLGRLLMWQGRMTEARAELEQVEAEILRVAQPALWQETRLLYFLGQLSLWEGLLEQAESYLTRFLEMSEQQADRWNALSARQSLAQVALRRGHLEDAERAYRQALQEAQELGRHRVAAYCSYGMGLVLMRRDQLGEAEDWLARSGEMALVGQELSLQADVLFARARLQKRNEQVTAALAWAYQAQGLYQRLGAQADIVQVGTFLAELESQ